MLCLVYKKEKMMKKTLLVFMLTGMSLCVFAQNGVIREVSGTVELMRSGETSYVPAKNGDEISGNTVIATGFRSYALVEIGGTTINVRPITRLTLTEISALENEESLRMYLRCGSVQVDVTPPAGTKASTTIQSPSATASVRGTSFYFDTRNLHVTQGTVLFKGNRGYTIQTGAGSTSIVEWNGTASAPQSASGYQDSTPAGYDPTAATGTEAPLIPASDGPGIADVGVEY